MYRYFEFDLLSIHIVPDRTHSHYHTALSEISNRIVGEILLRTIFFSMCSLQILLFSLVQRRSTESQMCEDNGLHVYLLTLKVLNFWKFTSYCSLKPLWSGTLRVKRPPWQVYTNIKPAIELSSLFLYIAALKGRHYIQAHVTGSAHILLNILLNIIPSTRVIK